MKGGNDKSLKRALSANRESKYLDFKESFDPTKPEGWCEIVKDIVSMANSGGGMIAIGVKNNGSPSQGDISTVLSLDPAQVTDKIAKYTGKQFGDITIQEAERNGHKIAVLQISCASIPMVFSEPGTYDIGGGRQKTAFSRGSIYFRHGAKSEPGNSNDLREAFDRELERVKKSWLGNIRKVVDAPAGYRVKVLPPEVRESDLPGATPIRIVDDPTAPAYRKIDPDQTYPNRQKEVVLLVNQKLNGRKSVTAYDIQSVRKVYRIDSNPNYYYKSKFSSPQYSNAFVDWLVEQFDKDSTFFDKARQKYKDGIHA
ncbi:MAG TPA: RNA-binding domain-containing protein [Candidatus Hypogeohydataceae bacterium YC41]